MSRSLVSLTAAAWLFGMPAAMAADLVIESPAEAGMVTDDYQRWDGAFVGAFAGYASGSHDEDDGAFVADTEGALVGVVAGANFTLTDGIVAGVVGDIAWSDIGLTSGDYSFDLDWLGSVRGRIGIDGGAFLPYLTAGVALAGTTADEDLTDHGVHVGWTAGAGVEFAVTDELSIDLLYRYSDYGTQTYNVNNHDYEASFTTHQVSAGLNWSF